MFSKQWRAEFRLTLQTQLEFWVAHVKDCVILTKAATLKSFAIVFRTPATCVIKDMPGGTERAVRVQNTINVFHSYFLDISELRLPIFLWYLQSFISLWFILPIATLEGVKSQFMTTIQGPMISFWCKHLRWTNFGKMCKIWPQF